MESLASIKYDTPHQPLQIRIDSTSRCNASCLSCHKFLSHRVGEMSLDAIRSVLQDIATWREPLAEICPVNYGEFMIRSDWFEILNMIATILPNTRIAFATNGSLFQNDTAQKLCSIPTLKWINFSVNAQFTETYKKFMGFPPEIAQRIEQSIAEIKVLRKDIITVVSMVFDPQWQTQLERDKFVDYWKDKSYLVINSATCCNLPFRKITQNTIPCRSVFSDIVIGYDGQIATCCFDPSFTIDLGNIKDYGGVLGAWNSEKFKKLRELHS